VKEQGFVMVPRAILKDPELSDHARLTWVLLASHADGAGRAYPSIATLARLLGRSRTVVGHALTELIAAGLLTRQHGQTVNHYTVHGLVGGQSVVPSGQPVASRAADNPVNGQSGGGRTGSLSTQETVDRPVSGLSTGQSVDTNDTQLTKRGDAPAGIRRREDQSDAVPADYCRTHWKFAPCWQCERDAYRQEHGYGEPTPAPRPDH
jgi:DNA-binding transcriptional MocR family regulator